MATAAFLSVGVLLSTGREPELGDNSIRAMRMLSEKKMRRKYGFQHEIALAIALLTKLIGEHADGVKKYCMRREASRNAIEIIMHQMHQRNNAINHWK